MLIAQSKISWLFSTCFQWHRGFYVAHYINETVTRVMNI